MAFTLSNSHLHFALEPVNSSWSLYTHTAETPAIEGARLNGLFRFPEANLTHLKGLRTWQWRGWLDEAEVSEATQEVSPHGPLDKLIVRVRSGLDALGITLEFALPRNQPFLLLRLRVQNQGNQPFQVVRLNPLFAGPLHHTGLVRLSSSAQPLTFFSNGWQSWSFAGALTAGQHQPATWLKPIQAPVIHNPATPLSDYAGQFSSDMFGILACPAQRTAIVAGFLSQREQFGSLDAVARADIPALRLRAQCDDVQLPAGTQLETDWAYVQLLTDYGPDPLKVYAEAAAREHEVTPASWQKAGLDGTQAGWCSWYQYFDQVTQADFDSNLAEVVKSRDQLPLKLVQLDDGFETNIGDWFGTNAKFPNGLPAIAQAIRAQNLVPGLWLAPFVAKPDAQIVAQHPEWFIKNRFNLPANAGFVFNTFSRGLDVSHPGVQEHVQRLISTAVNDWGFPYLKLDFLYAAALPGKRYDPTYTRAQAMRQGLDLIRQAAGPDTFILGCGCPLGSALGLVDAMRIGPDVDVRWRPKYKVSLPFYGEPGMPAARNAIRNTLARAPLHRRWWLNDPDCLLVRDTTGLSENEIRALASVIALSGGLLMLSDGLPDLGPDRRALIEPLLPVLGQAAVAVDWLDREMPELVELPLSGAVGDWKVIGLFNWSELPANRSLPLTADSHIFDFWNQTYTRAQGRLDYPNLAPHSGRLLAVRPALPGPQFVGSSFHFSQGAEVSHWQGTGQGVRFVIDLKRVAEGDVYLSLPDVLPTTGERLPNGLHRLHLSVGNQAQVQVEW